MLSGYAVYKNTRNFRVPHLRSSQANEPLRNYIEEYQQFTELSEKKRISIRIFIVYIIIRIILHRTTAE